MIGLHRDHLRRNNWKCLGAYRADPALSAHTLFCREVVMGAEMSELPRADQLFAFDDRMTEWTPFGAAK